jgi:hypothetical protein
MQVDTLVVDRPAPHREARLIGVSGVDDQPAPPGRYPGEGAKGTLGAAIIKRPRREINWRIQDLITNRLGSLARGRPPGGWVMSGCCKMV